MRKHPLYFAFGLAMVLLSAQRASAVIDASGPLKNLGCAAKASEAFTHETGIRDGRIIELVPATTYEVDVNLNGQERAYTMVAPSDSFDPSGCGTFKISDEK